MSGYPHTSKETPIQKLFKYGSIGFFYQHSMDMIGWFKQNKAKSESSNWILTSGQQWKIILHLLYWDHSFMEHRFLPTANGERKLIALNDPRTNEKSITIAAKGFSYLVQDLERSRKQMCNILGELDDKQWKVILFILNGTELICFV